MSAISDKVYLHKDGVRLLLYGRYLTSDRDSCVECGQRLGLEKILSLGKGVHFSIPTVFHQSPARQCIFKVFFICFSLFIYLSPKIESLYFKYCLLLYIFNIFKTPPPLPLQALKWTKAFGPCRAHRVFLPL